MENNNPHSINDELLTRYLLGEADANEIAAVETWLKTDPLNSQHLNKLKTVLDMVSFAKMDVDSEWETFKPKLKPRTIEIKMEPAQRKGYMAYWAIAASVAVLIGLTMFFALFYNPKPETILAEAKNNIVDLKLADGSQVSLNRGATLEYPEKFNGKQRRVALTGDAWFNITPDTANPFVVETKDFSVTVLGTAFFVRAAADAPQEVLVEHGKVKCEHKSSGETVTLTAGQKYTFGSLTNQPTTASVPEMNDYAWKTAKLAFENESMENIAGHISNTYGCRVILNGGVENCTLTVTFEDLTLDGVLNVLQSILDARISRNGNTVEISAPGC